MPAFCQWDENENSETLPVLKAFFDESGVHDGSPMVALGGFIGSPHDWQTVEQQWAALLHHFGIPYYHSSEVEGHWTFGHEAKNIMGFAKVEFAKILSASPLLPIFCIMPAWTWSHACATKPRFSAIFRKPYHFCFAEMMKSLSQLAEERAPPEKVLVTLSDTVEYAARATEAYAFARDNALDVVQSIIGLSFVAMKVSPALQAADMLLYDIHSQLVNSADPASRKLLSQLEVSNKLNLCKFISPEDMDNFFAATSEFD